MVPSQFHDYGNIGTDQFQLVFLPKMEQKLEFVIRKEGGEVVHQVPYKLTSSFAPNYPMMGTAQSVGPAYYNFKEAGKYVAEFRVDGQAATAMPFSVAIKGANDAFSNKKFYTLDGPWRTLAVLSHLPDDPDKAAVFSWWVSSLEGGEAKVVSYTVQVLREGQPISEAATVNAGGPSWGYIALNLEPKGQRNRPLTFAALTKQDGNYQIVLKVGPKQRTYSFSVKGGAIKRLARTEVGYSPQTEFIAPRSIRRNPATDKLAFYDDYWLQGQ